MDAFLTANDGDGAVEFIMGTLNPFQMFGTEPVSQVDTRALKKKYYKISRMIHPDKRQSNRHANTAFQKFLEAYTDLQSPDKLPGILIKVGAPPRLYKEAVSYVLSEVSDSSEEEEEVEEEAPPASSSSGKQRASPSHTLRPRRTCTPVIRIERFV